MQKHLFYCRSVLSVMDFLGSIRNSYEYDPFGKVLWKSEGIRNIFQYIGRYGVIRDHEIQNLYMMRARHYDAEHGRFISLDPIGQLLIDKIELTLFSCCSLIHKYTLKKICDISTCLTSCIYMMSMSQMKISWRTTVLQVQGYSPNIKRHNGIK